MIRLNNYTEAARIVTRNICANCGTELLIIPLIVGPHGAEEYGIVCSRCKYSLPGWIPDPKRSENEVPRNFTQSIPRVNRFWKHVRIPRMPDNKPDLDLCWIFTGSSDRKGYGYYGGEARTMRSNRYAFFISRANESVPSEWVIMHACDNPACTNPAHLSAGTRNINAQAALLRNRCRRRLSPAKVMQLLDDHDRGATTQQLAEKYGVKTWQIGAIVSGYSWSWLTGKPCTRKY